MKDQEYLLERFFETFWRYGVISVPDLDGMAHKFMDRLNENNVTYQFEFLKLSQVNFYLITKL